MTAGFFHGSERLSSALALALHRRPGMRNPTKKTLRRPSIMAWMLRAPATTLLLGALIILGALGVLGAFGCAGDPLTEAPNGRAVIDLTDRGAAGVVVTAIDASPRQADPLSPAGRLGAALTAEGFEPVSATELIQLDAAGRPLGSFELQHWADGARLASIRSDADGAQAFWLDPRDATPRTVTFLALDADAVVTMRRDVSDPEALLRVLAENGAGERAREYLFGPGGTDPAWLQVALVSADGTVSLEEVVTVAGGRSDPTYLSFMTLNADCAAGELVYSICLELKNCFLPVSKICRLICLGSSNADCYDTCRRVFDGTTGGCATLATTLFPGWAPGDGNGLPGGTLDDPPPEPSPICVDDGTPDLDPELTDVGSL
jgi:hypothetical protein